MRELVVNSAEGFQFVLQKWHDLPRRNRGQKSCKCKPGLSFPTNYNFIHYVAYNCQNNKTTNVMLKKFRRNKKFIKICPVLILYLFIGVVKFCLNTPQYKFNRGQTQSFTRGGLKIKKVLTCSFVRLYVLKHQVLLCAAQNLRSGLGVSP